MAHLKLLPGSNTSVGVRQKINAGHNFDGTRFSDTGLTSGYGMTLVPIADAGGLFDFEVLEPVVITQFVLYSAAALTWTLYVVDLDPVTGAETGVPMIVDTGVGATSVWRVKPQYLLGPNQALKLVTVGAVAAITAEVWATLERSYQH